MPNLINSHPPPPKKKKTYPKKKEKWNAGQFQIFRSYKINFYQQRHILYYEKIIDETREIRIT